MEQAEKLSITVTPAMARTIREKVETGAYASASEVIRAAMRALQREDEEHAERLAAVKARIRASVEDEGPGLASEDVRNRLLSLHETFAKRPYDPAT